MTLTATMKVQRDGEQTAVSCWIAPDQSGVVVIRQPNGDWKASKVPPTGLRNRIEKAVTAATTTVLASNGSEWDGASHIHIEDVELPEVKPTGQISAGKPFAELLERLDDKVPTTPSLNPMPFKEVLATVLLAIDGAAEDASNALDAAGIPWRDKDTTDSSSVSAIATALGHDTDSKDDPLKPIEWGDGKVFHPRMMWWGETDYQFVKRVVLQNGRILAIKGPPGSGKTFLVDAVTEGNVISMTCSANTSHEQLYGGWFPVIRDGVKTFEFRPGAWPLAMTANGGRGCTLFLDESFRVDPDLWGPSYSVTDGRGYLDVDNPDQPRIFAGPDFRVIMAFNPKVEGTFIDEPSWSRIDKILEYPTNWDVVKRIMGGKHRKIITVARNLATHAENGWEGQTLETRDLVQYKQAVDVDGEPEVLAAATLLGKVESPADLQVWTETFESVMGFTNLKPLTAE